MVCVNVSTMEIITAEAMLALKDKPDERIISFNLKYLKEALNFIMCSDDEYIEIYYTNSAKALVIKSSRLYALLLPVLLRNE